MAVMKLQSYEMKKAINRFGTAKIVGCIRKNNLRQNWENLRKSHRRSILQISYLQNITFLHLPLSSSRVWSRAGSVPNNDGWGMGTRKRKDKLKGDSEWVASGKTKERNKEQLGKKDQMWGSDTTHRCVGESRKGAWAAGSGGKVHY